MFTLFFSFRLNYNDKDQNLKNTGNLGILVSLKVHVVFEHIVHFCKKHNNGLGVYSEQSLESSHYDYKPFWEKSYKVPMNHPDYGEKLLESVYMYNALHV